MRPRKENLFRLLATLMLANYINCSTETRGDYIENAIASSDGNVALNPVIENSCTRMGLNSLFSPNNCAEEGGERSSHKSIKKDSGNWCKIPENVCKEIIYLIFKTIKEECDYCPSDCFAEKLDEYIYETQEFFANFNSENYKESRNPKKRCCRNPLIPKLAKLYDKIDSSNFNFNRKVNLISSKFIKMWDDRKLNISDRIRRLVARLRKTKKEWLKKKH